ncbi:hypothetical protein CR513_19931, partial [Mucuna pruriens]
MCKNGNSNGEESDSSGKNYWWKISSCLLIWLTLNKGQIICGCENMTILMCTRIQYYNNHMSKVMAPPFLNVFGTSFFKCFWIIPIMSNVFVFGWKLDSTKSKPEKEEHGVTNVNLSCPFCHNEEETSVNLLFACSIVANGTQRSLFITHIGMVVSLVCIYLVTLII